MSSSIYAISIDSMFKFADADHNSYFTITNESDDRLYMNTSVSEIKVVDGELEKTPYTRDNLMDWYIGVRPAKTIIDGKFKKDFKISTLCEDCTVESDRVFQISFLPTPYTTGLDKPENSINVAVGLGPVVILPGKEKPIKLLTKYADNTILFKNNGDSVVKLTLTAQACEEKEGESCSYPITVLSGRLFKFDVPKSMQNLDIDAKAVTAFNKYESSFRVKQGE
ncbi:hypothetical protein GCM10007916_28670 [Psychromonas marina]|uniref:Molecular chaperone n=2 Tax=Psychromonas marina TaxID=88364 RepID=A0ABQ6E381_9GAMM|nr:hypothetical protein GCM10007916_28670 [Psychromonas marina]